MQTILIIGNLTHDPETRATPSGVTVCSFTVAVNRRYTKADGSRDTDFFRVNAWRGLGEICSKYLVKGKKVAVKGELQARLYEAKDGTTRMSLDIAADEVEFLSPRTAGGTERAEDSNSHQETDVRNFTDVSSDDIPF